MYTCHTHGWRSMVSPCPACQIVQDASGGEDVVFFFPKSQAPTKEGLEERAEMWKDWQDGKYPDLSHFTHDEKTRIISEFTQMVAKNTMMWFYSFGLKTHIEVNVINPSTDETFLFSFKKVIAGAQSSLQPSSPDPTVLVQALRDIIEVKLEPGENDYKYAFNRCWHIATEALNNKKEEDI